MRAKSGPGREATRALVRSFADSKSRPASVWISVMFAVIGVALLPLLVHREVGVIARLWALGSVRPADGLAAPPSDGAIFRGRLIGTPERTPLGYRAIAWVGTVERIHRQGKSTYNSEMCRLGDLSGLSLETAAGRLALAPRQPREVTVDRGNRAATLSTPLWWLSGETVTDVPQEVIDRCALGASELAHDAWTYREHDARNGDRFDFAGCLQDGALTGCRGGVAAGHLAAGGIRQMMIGLADTQAITIGLVAILCSFFSIVGGFDTVLALRRAAGASGGVL